MTRVAVITGPNKGIGFAIVKGLLKQFTGDVYLTSRNDDRGMSAVEKLQQIGLKPKYHQLDVTDRQSIIRFRNHIEENYGGIDILVNNAAVANTINFYNTYEECKNVLDINYYSILSIQELLFPLVRDNGRILNISSDCVHLSNLRNDYWIHRLSKEDLTVIDVNEFVNWFLQGIRNGTFKYDNLADEGTLASYRIAKIALSAITRVHQKELDVRNISINSMHPGLVKTDMTEGVGFYDVEQAAETPLYLVLDAPQELKGSYVWYDRQVLDWFDYNADYYFKSKMFKREGN